MSYLHHTNADLDSEVSTAFIAVYCVSKAEV
jgi:hypothetical protein